MINDNPSVAIIIDRKGSIWAWLRVVTERGFDSHDLKSVSLPEAFEKARLLGFEPTHSFVVNEDTRFYPIPGGVIAGCKVDAPEAPK